MSVYSPQSPSFSLEGDNHTDEKGPRSQRNSYFRRGSQVPALMDVDIGALHSPPVQSASRQEPLLEKERRDNPVVTFYRSLSWMMGFREKYSLFLFFFCGGALLGFCLARAFTMDGKIRPQQTPPGDYRWFSLAPYRVSYIFHIYTTIIGGILVGLQFLPIIRRNYVLIHRLNGYLCAILLIPGNIAGAVVARRSLGGEINVQAAYYLLAIMLVISMLLGLYNVKRNTRAHRKWMLRSVAYFSVVVLSRFISVIARAIITRIGVFYSVWRCDEVLYVIQDSNELSQRFPQCVNNTSDLTNNPFSVAVHASDHEGLLGAGSSIRVVTGMCLWLSTLIVALGVEIYRILSLERYLQSQAQAMCLYNTTATVLTGLPEVLTRKSPLQSALDQTSVICFRIELASYLVPSYHHLMSTNKKEVSIDEQKLGSLSQCPKTLQASSQECSSRRPPDGSSGCTADRRWYTSDSSQVNDVSAYPEDVKERFLGIEFSHLGPLTGAAEHGASRTRRRLADSKGGFGYRTLSPKLLSNFASFDSTCCDAEKEDKLEIVSPYKKGGLIEEIVGNVHELCPIIGSQLNSITLDGSIYGPFMNP
ncbi:hypothetical protein K435DRAFT_839235 [Dendrothele bispora CBS 962.96]|uniref:DUF2306 domain-containing protein n=1 Tax=Dendrothele bispora (strain CBS 962.96) TaxID=1314807 RepID=A0A4S8M296_DENBC|nr:hypothetical protein K435DRAFT_839235 [Dendrothele bispora CBS 962.96]